MKHLAKSIQPTILKPFVESSFTFGIKEFSSGNTSLLKSLVEITVEVLKDDNVQETNKITIAQVLCDQILVCEIKSKVLLLLRIF